MRVPVMQGALYVKPWKAWIDTNGEILREEWTPNGFPPFARAIEQHWMRRLFSMGGGAR